jgi:pantothenate kinase type III
VTLLDRPAIVNDVRCLLREKKIEVVSLNASMPNKKTLKLNMVIRKPSEVGMDKVINLVNSLDEAQSMEID